MRWGGDTEYHEWLLLQDRVATGGVGAGKGGVESSQAPAILEQPRLAAVNITHEALRAGRLRVCLWDMVAPGGFGAEEGGVESNRVPVVLEQPCPAAAILKHKAFRAGRPRAWWKRMGGAGFVRPA